MDNFKFRDFPDDITDNAINEDNRIYCSFSLQDDSCDEIPPYSMSLWNQCLKLLSTNSTITNLSITHYCGGGGGGCNWDEWYSDFNGLFNENFLNDFMNSLANNKTIKTLTIDFHIFGSLDEYENHINLIKNKSYQYNNEKVKLDNGSIMNKQQLLVESIELAPLSNNYSLAYYSLANLLTNSTDTIGLFGETYTQSELFELALKNKDTLSLKQLFQIKSNKILNSLKNLFK
ncbi:hypothetical protein ACTFIZ_005912 [Dictyostelium cf. discoideum]